MKVHITITVGVAKYKEQMSLENWVEVADKKMYSGKKSGKNKVVF